MKKVLAISSGGGHWPISTDFRSGIGRTAGGDPGFYSKLIRKKVGAGGTAILVELDAGNDSESPSQQ